MVRAAALATGAGMVASALSTSSLAVLLAALVVAVASGVMATALLPLLFDTYRPELRVRIIGGYGAAVVAAFGMAQLLDLLAGGIGLTWRAALLAIAVVPFVAAVLSLGLGDPPVGRWDLKRIGRLVESNLGAGTTEGAGDLGAADTGLTRFERFRRSTTFSSAPAAVSCAAVFGIFLWGFPSAFEVFLRERWAVVGSSSDLLFAVLCLATVPGVLWFASRAEVSYRRSPRYLLQMASSVTLVAAATTAVAVVAPIFSLTVLCLWIAFTAYATLLVVAAFVWLTLCPPHQRGHAAVLLGAIVLLGTQIGPQIVNTFGSRFGIEWAMVIVAAVPLGAAAALGRAVVTVDADVDALVGRIVETHELATRVALGHHLPLLSCRNINFSYGQVQVLFDVSLTVDEGEMVALLGTNGAGKSTLLRLVSGLEFPSSGSIHYQGEDVTFLGSDRRVDLGISQIPGGRAVFGPLTVTENLRAFGYTLGRDRSRLDSGIDEAFAALPRLAERRNQLASTLSGGERQMLALAKSYLLRPRLLVIDELSLGLAPIIVGELLEMVRQVNAAGTAIILVEQSVNVALSTVDHAYFMEKGEMRFDGVASDLLARPDLLRSVFLQGATQGLETGAVK
jgi:ABC-type branched-subunit amino acid transport system ATPase component